MPPLEDGRSLTESARDVVTIVVEHFGSARAGELSEAELADEIYAQLHCRLPAAAWARDARGDVRLDPRDFPHLLARANHGTGAWQSGWTVRAVRADGGVVAESMGVRFWVARGEFRAAREPVEPGAPIEVRVPCDYRQLVPGFYMATGDADDEDGAPAVRLYWNVSARGALPLVEGVTTNLNAAGITFRVKVPLDPRDFGRADAAVLYLRRGDFDTAMPHLARITAAARRHLSPETSLLAYECEPGVCVAEDPGHGASFGQHRARLLAKIIRTPAVASLASSDARADAVRTQLRALGLDPVQLHLNAGSTAEYRWASVESPDA